MGNSLWFGLNKHQRQIDALMEEVLLHHPELQERVGKKMLEDGLLAEFRDPRFGETPASFAKQIVVPVATAVRRYKENMSANRVTAEPYSQLYLSSAWESEYFEAVQKLQAQCWWAFKREMQKA